MGGKDWIVGESQTPGWNFEQQEEDIEGLAGPATDEEQSMEEQGIWWCKFCGYFILRETLDKSHL